MNILDEIAEYLRAPPFNMKVNLVTLDEQTPQAWLQLLSNVLTTLNEEPAIDLRDEPIDQTAFRLSDFLAKILLYRDAGKPFAH